YVGRDVREIGVLDDRGVRGRAPVGRLVRAQIDHAAVRRLDANVLVARVLDDGGVVRVDVQRAPRLDDVDVAEGDAVHAGSHRLRADLGADRVAVADHLLVQEVFGVV